MFRIGLTFGFVLTAAACTTTVSDSLEGAPAWFEERKADLSDEGYPPLQSALNLDAEYTNTPWGRIQRNLRNAKREMDENDPGPVTVTADEMRAWAQEQIRLVDRGEEPY